MYHEVSDFQTLNKFHGLHIYACQQQMLHKICTVANGAWLMTRVKRILVYTNGLVINTVDSQAWESIWRLKNPISLLWFYFKLSLYHWADGPAVMTHMCIVYEIVWHFKLHLAERVTGPKNRSSVRTISKLLFRINTAIECCHIEKQF